MANSDDEPDEDLSDANNEADKKSPDFQDDRHANISALPDKIRRMFAKYATPPSLLYTSKEACEQAEKSITFASSTNSEAGQSASVSQGMCSSFAIIHRSYFLRSYGI